MFCIDQMAFPSFTTSPKCEAAVCYGTTLPLDSTGQADVTGQLRLSPLASGAYQQTGLRISIRGELAFGCDGSHRNLVFGWPLRARTMKQPFASSARLRGGGHILPSACWPWRS